MPAHEEVEDSVRERLQRACAKQTLVFLSLAICINYRTKCSFQVPWGTQTVEMCGDRCVWSECRGDFPGSWVKASAYLQGNGKWPRMDSDFAKRGSIQYKNLQEELGLGANFFWTTYCS